MLNRRSPESLRRLAVARLLGAGSRVVAAPAAADVPRGDLGAAGVTSTVGGVDAFRYPQTRPKSPPCCARPRASGWPTSTRGTATG